MEHISLDNLKFAVNGFVSSVSQTGSDLGSSLADWSSSISDKLPSHWTQVLPSVRTPPPPPRHSVFQDICDWVYEHRVGAVLFATFSASFAGFLYFGTPSLDGRNVYYRHMKSMKKRSPRRLARRAETGGRQEVVLLVGSPNEPLVKLIAQDLNIRGFIVYVTATPSEEATLAKFDSDDICALKLDSYFDPVAVKQAVARLGQVLDTPVRAFPGAGPHDLRLAGVLIIPDLFYPVGPVEMTTSTQWVQTVQSKLLMPLNFLCLGGIDLARRHGSRFVLVTPTIMGSLAPAFHAPESVVCGALSSLALSLTRELEPQGVPFTHMRLGSFDTRPVKLRSPSPVKRHAYSPQGSPQGSPPSPPPHRQSVQADILSWPEDMRRLYGSRFRSTNSSGSKGSNIRELYHAIYDTLSAKSPKRVVRVGRGSSMYDWVSAYVPERALSALLAAN